MTMMYWLNFPLMVILSKDKTTRATLLEGTLKEVLYPLDISRVPSRIKASSPYLKAPCIFLCMTENLSNRSCALSNSSVYSNDQSRKEQNQFMAQKVGAS